MSAAPAATRPLPPGWRWARLGDVAEAVRGATFPSGAATYRPTPNAIACLTTSAVQDELAWDSRCYIPEVFVKSDEQRMRDGDILVSTANSKALVGKSCVASSTPEPATFGAFVTVLRARDVASTDYLAHYLRSPQAMEYAWRESSNTTNISNLKVSVLLEQPIPLSPLPEQRRIAAVLREQLDAVRRAREAALARLEAARALPAAFLRSVFESEEAQSWPSAKFGSFVSSYRNGFGRRPQADEDGPIVLRIADVSSGTISLATPRRGAMTEREFATYSVQRGDLLFIRVNGSSDVIGRCIVVEDMPEAVAYNDHLIRVRTSEALVPTYFRLISDDSTIREQTSGRATTTAGQLTVNQDVLASIEFPCPPVPRQSEIVSAIQLGRARGAALAAVAEAELTAINALPQSLLRQAFAGEL